MSEESDAVHQIVMRVCNHIKIFCTISTHFLTNILFFTFAQTHTRREHVNRYYNGHRTRSQSGGQTKSQRVVALVHESVVDVHLSLILIILFPIRNSNSRFRYLYDWTTCFASRRHLFRAATVGRWRQRRRRTFRRRAEYVALR